MTDPPTAPGATAGGTSALVADLESTVARQVQRARQGDLQQAMELGGHVQTLLQSLRSVRPEGLRRHADCLMRVERLQHHLELALALQQKESAARRTRLGRGKVALRAYGGR